jgi:hypothetical protein
MPADNLVSFSRFNPRVLLALLLSCLLWPALAARAVELWVSPALSGPAGGPPGHAFVSIPAAIQKIRELRRLAKISTNEPAKIILPDGLYPLAGPLRLTSGDSGTESSPTIIEAVPGGHPVLSGGVRINGWKPLTKRISGLPEIARGKVWGADAPMAAGRILDFRQLWVNGRKAVRSREPNNDNLARLVAWDQASQVATIPAGSIGILPARMPALFARLEMVVEQDWEIAVLRVKSIRLQGTNALLTFRQPESEIEFQHPWPPVIVNKNYQAPFFLANAIAFLDSPGEWFEDLAAGKIYYWPRDGENMAHARVFAPALETLVQIEGTPDRPVSNLQFKGVTFAHTTWLRPSEAGHVPLQAGMFLLAAHKLSPKGMPYHRGLDNVAWIGRPPAAVSVQNADHISFGRCVFEHTASAGLDFEGGTHDDLVEGCVFRDIGGNGIQLGKFSDTNVETHVPWNPSDQRKICTDERLADNLVTDCANEDWGCVGIAVGYARGVEIEHNDISDCSYTGISVGWGWTKMNSALRDNFIRANHVHHVATRLCDTAGIYTLSAQPGTVINDNAISGIKMSRYVFDPQHWFYLYLDEGSSGITVRDNWCPAEKFLKNANGPGNVWENNGPQVSEKKRDAAGLEPAFQDLLHETNVP